MNHWGLFSLVLQTQYYLPVQNNSSALKNSNFWTNKKLEWIGSTFVEYESVNYTHTKGGKNAK